MAVNIEVITRQKKVVGKKDFETRESNNKVVKRITDEGPKCVLPTMGGEGSWSEGFVGF